MDKLILLNEARYAERLCLRTARLYKRLQTATVFLGVLGGSGVIAGVSTAMPAWLPLAGGVLLAVFGAINLAVRPADKAAANEADAKRYAQLRTSGRAMNEIELQAALDKARETDTPEIEALRDVAYNDLLLEIGCADEVLPLKRHQRLLGALA